MTAFFTMAFVAVLLLLQGARHRHCPARTLTVLGSLVLQRGGFSSVEGRPPESGPAPPSPPRPTLPPSPTPTPGPLPETPLPSPPSPPPLPPPPPSTTDNCTQLTPVSEVTEGPYWIDENIEATNVRLNLSYGVPFNLTVKVSNGTLSASQGSCVPIEQARVDLWQCRYDGLYSDEEDESTAGETWLRGYQYTNSTGHASFRTIIPGWYVSRTPHIHIRVRIYEADGNTTSYDDTTQLYFNDTITTAIYKYVYPYNSRGFTMQDTFNNNDSLFTSTNLLTLKGSYIDTEGYSSFVEFKLPFDHNYSAKRDDANNKSGGDFIAIS